MGEFTYEQLFDVVRRERAREELQELDPYFYRQASEYTKDLEQQVRSHDPLASEADQIRTQLANSKKLLREVYDRREKKILFLALNKVRTGSNMIDTSAVIESEMPLFDNLLIALKKQREQLAPSPPPSSTARSTAYTPKRTASPSAKEPEEKKPVQPASGELKIKVTASVPKFLGANGETHGPYEQGTEIALPERIARILIRKGRAEHA
jgi:DNA replication initiation complex subunit (GINS family)